MEEIRHFVTGLPPTPAAGIAAYLPAMPPGVAPGYIQALSPPGGLVIDPFCQTGEVLREAVMAGRRALGANLNPVTACWIESQLWPPDQLAVREALARLVDQPRGETTLRQYLADLYSTRCPTCQGQAVAEYFVWKRDADGPIEKRVRCDTCGMQSAGPADEADVAAARRFDARGMAYWFLLERAAPDGSDLDVRERAAEVVQACTPRALAVLADLLRKYDSASPADRQTLAPLLLAVFEAGVALHPAENGRPRPRSLKVPARFVEHNLWLAVEEAMGLIATSDQALPRVRRADPGSVLSRQAPAAALVRQNARDLARHLSPGSVSLILTLPPQADPTFWALSAVWSRWVWAPPPAEKHGPVEDAAHALLAHRRAGMDWWWRGLAQSTAWLTPTLAPGARLVFVSAGADEQALAGWLLAGASAGLALESALVEAALGMRVVFQAVPDAPVSDLVQVQALEAEIGARARQAAADLLTERGEPAAWASVHAEVHAGLARAGLLHAVARLPASSQGADPLPLDLLKDAIRRGLAAPGSPVYALPGDELWWLADPRDAALPLADRVEAAVREWLQNHPAPVAESELIAEMYQRFPARLTPELEMIRLCLSSYATCSKPGGWHLRQEDQAGQREAEIAALREQVMQVGTRLGYGVSGGQDRLMWTEQRRPVYTFVFSATAELGQHLVARRPPRGQPVLVLPGGRAALAHSKLRRNVRLREAAQGAGWLFCKFRQLRYLAANPDLDRTLFSEGLEMDRLLETEAEQIPLF